MRAIKRNMKDQKDPKVLYCEMCASEWSGHTGDYPGFPDDHVFTCATCNCELELIPMEEFKPLDNLYDLLEEWKLLLPNERGNDEGPKDWYAVSNKKGTVAFFLHEKAAARFILTEINQILNG